MVRVFNVYYPVRTLVLAFGEALLIYASFLLAALIYFRDQSTLVLGYESGLYKITLAAAVCLLCLHYNDLYDSLIASNPREILTRVVRALGAACLIMAFVYYIFPMARLDLTPLVLGMVLLSLLLSGWRKLFLALNRSPRWAQRALILGTGPLAASLSTEIGKRPEWAVRLIGYVGSPPESRAEMDGLPRLGAVEDLTALVKRERVSQIIVGMRERRGCLPVETLLRLKARGTVIRDGANVYEALTGKVPLESLRPSWLLFSPGFRVSPGTLAYKRVTSLMLATLGLLVTLPLMILIAIAIRLDSEGPVLFRQERVGQDGKIFKLNKFRTMRVGSDPDGVYKPAQENDDRVTRFGRWLRRSRLDELPQLYNILRGDMYFIGPRPFVPNQEEECVARIPFYRQRWTIKPGATGWAQIKRGYCASLEDNADKLAYDLFYIKNMSIGLDLLIGVETVKILVLGRGGR